MTAIRTQRTLAANFRRSSSILASLGFHAGLFVLSSFLFLPNSKAAIDFLLLNSAPPTIETIEFHAMPHEQLDVPSCQSDHSLSAERSETVAAKLEIDDVAWDDLATAEPWGSDLGQWMQPVAGRPQGNTVGGPQNKGDGSQRPYGTFFGLEATGDRCVFIVDMSRSMRGLTHRGMSRFRLATNELMRSVNALPEDKQFYVIVFCYQTYFLPGPESSQPYWLSATKENKELLRHWLIGIQLGAGTDPRFGLLTALGMQADAIFLLSDGEFNGQEMNLHGIPGNLPVEPLLARSWNGVPIHTIALAQPESRTRLAKISKVTGGKHRFIQ